MTVFLPENERMKITRGVRSIVARHLELGVSTGTLIICRACGFAKPLIGATCYNSHRLCNDCTLDYELAHAAKTARDVKTFIEERKRKTLSVHPGSASPAALPGRG